MVEEETSLVNGVVVSKRKNGDKMAIWLRDAGQTSEVMRVGRLVKDNLKVEGRVHFHVHREAKTWGMGKNTFV